MASAIRVQKTRTSQQEEAPAHSVLLIQHTHLKGKRASVLAGVKLGIAQHQEGPQ